MNEFNKTLEIINGFLKTNQHNSIFPICEKILNEDFSPKEKAQIYFIMASSYKELEKYTDALVNYSNCINLDKNKEYAYCRKSELLLKLDRIEAALSCCNQGLIIFEDNSLLIQIKNQCEKKLYQFNMEDTITTNIIAKDKLVAKLNNASVAPICIIEPIAELAHAIKTPSAIKVQPIVKVPPAINERKGSPLVKIILIALLTIISVFLLAYTTYSSYSSKKEKANVKNTSEKQSVKVKPKENIQSDKPVYLIKNEIPTDPFKGSIDGNPNFIFPESNSVKLTYTDLLNKTLDELYVARNELFARHGYIFTNAPKLNSYFRNKSWYIPSSSAKAVTSNDIELSNSDIIKQVEVSRIAYYNYGDKPINGFVIETSGNKNIKKEDLNSLKDWELIIARNEIFARHGMIFGIPQIADHFKAQSFYKPVEKFDDSIIKQLEYDNLKILQKEESIRYSKILNR